MMISATKHQDCNVITNGRESRTLKSPDTATNGLEQKLKDCSLTDILEKDDLCKVNGQESRGRLDQERFRVERPRFNSDNKPRSFPPSAMGSRPILQKKSYSDLSSYRNVQMKILVEGPEVLDSRFQGDCCFGLGNSLQECSTDQAKFTRTQEEQERTKNPGKFLAGWLTKKTQSKSQNADKYKEPPIGFRSLKRSKSFSVKIRDKIKSISATGGTSDAPGSPEKSNGLQPPFYKIIELQDLNNHEDVIAFRRQYQRRHSDQTDSMSRRAIGTTRYDFKSQKYYTLSLDRERRQHSTSSKRPLARKKSNSLEAPLEFPFWSQITDASRSRSCNGRIRVSETRRDTDGTLETNLCSTEL